MFNVDDVESGVSNLMWSNIVDKMIELQASGGIRLQPQVIIEDIQRAEQVLNVSFPEELVRLLIISNGAEQLMKNPRTDELMVIDYLYWPINELVTNTLLQYEYLEKIESKDKTKYLFFADNGCGESFGYRIENGKCNSSVIYIYYPIDNEYVAVASSLREWIERWLTQEIQT